MARTGHKPISPSIRFWRQVDRTQSMCWVWKGALSHHGYGMFNIAPLPGNRSKTVMAHRASWLLFVGNIPKGMCVLHYCDNRKCVNPTHLWLGTVQDNQKDMVLKGRAVTCGRYNRVSGLKETSNKDTLSWRRTHGL